MMAGWSGLLRVGCLLIIVLVSTPREAWSQTVFSDNFSGAHPGQWTVGHDGGSGTFGWAWPSGYAHAYSSQSGGQFFYPDNLHVFLDRRNVSLAGYASATLTFSYIVDTEATYDFFTVNVRDSSGQWHELFRKSGPSSLSWTQKTLDLSAFVGQSNLIVQFRFDTDGSVSGSPYDGVYLDTVSLQAGVAPVPSITSRTLDASSVLVNNPFHVDVTGKNTGGAASSGGIAVQVRQAFSNGVEVTESHTASGAASGTSVWWKNDILGTGGPAQYLHVEPTWTGWEANGSRTVNVTITPKKVGVYDVYVKMYLNVGNSFPRDPAGSSPNADHQNQATYYLGRVTVSAAPVPSITARTIDKPSVGLNQPVQVTVSGKNNGGAASFGGIAVQVRQAFQSGVEMTEEHNAAGASAGQSVWWKNEPLATGHSAQYLHVEPTWSSWEANGNRTLTVTLTPKKAGTYSVYAKMYLNVGASFPRDPAGSSPNGDHQNQATYLVGTITVGGTPDITVDPLELSFARPPADRLPDIRPPLRALGVSVSSAVSDAIREQGFARVIVQLDIDTQPAGLLDAPRAAAQQQAISAGQDQVVARLVGTETVVTRRFETIPFIALQVGAEGLAALQRSPEVVAVNEDRLVQATLAESIPLVQGDRAWQAGFEGTGWAVAVLDTGVDGAHPFLSGKIVSEACYSEDGDCPNGGTTQVGAGAAVPCTYAGGCNHGTHVAGIAAGSGASFSGVARGADIVAIQVFSRFTGQDCANMGEDPCARTYFADQIAGLERVFALRNSLQIAAVNMSLGGDHFTSQATCDAQNAGFKAAIDNLRSVGIATVIASGNDAFDDGMNRPGCISTAVSVGSTTKADVVSGFSNSASFLSLLAPGSGINSSVPGGGFTAMDGTSMATPHVAGAWAILKEASPTASVAEILQNLQNTGLQITDSRNGVTRPRIRIADALAHFVVSNTGTGDLQILSIQPDQTAAWILLSPSAPFSIAPGESKSVFVSIDWSRAPMGRQSRRLLITSNVSAKSPYPGGVNIITNHPPDAPAAASATNVSTSAFKANWSGASGAAGYRLDVSLSAAFATLVSGYNNLDVGNVTSRDVTGLISNRNYYYRVRAYNDGGTSGQSNVVSLTTNPDVPSPPTANAASSVTNTTFVANWTASVGATGYRLDVSRVSTFTDFVSGFQDLDVGNVTNRSVAGLNPGAGYYYRLRAYNAAGVSASSATIRLALPFTDQSLLGGVVRAIHLAELRSRIDELRVRRGLGLFNWSTPQLQSAFVIAQHVRELRTALAGVYATLNIAMPPLTDPDLGPGTSIKAAHFEEIRAAIAAIQ